MPLKLLFLCKRRPMSRDLVTSPYGRFFYLPKYLAECGHQVCLMLLDYENGEPLDLRRDGIHWISEPLSWHGPTAYVRRLQQLCRSFQPDWITGFSDTFYGILAERYARKFAARSCIDAYDNYESYMPLMKPLHLLWRRALSRADLVTAAGPGLLQHMSRGRNGKAACVVPMSADPVGFTSMDRNACRQQLNLPTDRKFVGYCGSTHRNRGVEVLFDACEMLQERISGVSLLVSGRSWKNVAIPESAFQLGYVPDEQMPVVLNSMDVLSVINRASNFGNFSYPVKLYEAMTCDIPVVVTETPATRWILQDFSDCLVPPSDASALCARLEQSLVRGRTDYGDPGGWQTGAGLLEQAMLEKQPGG
jgi:glycosyltransferase involved in cell wall biosynthesis